MLSAGPGADTRDLAIEGVDHIQLPLDHLAGLAVLPAVAKSVDHRLDLMLVPQALDELAVVVALVGAQVLTALQQGVVALFDLIDQP